MMYIETLIYNNIQRASIMSIFIKTVIALTFFINIDAVRVHAMEERVSEMGKMESTAYHKASILKSFTSDVQREAVEQLIASIPTHSWDSTAPHLVDFLENLKPLDGVQFEEESLFNQKFFESINFNNILRVVKENIEKISGESKVIIQDPNFYSLLFQLCKNLTNDIKKLEDVRNLHGSLMAVKSLTNSLQGIQIFEACLPFLINIHTGNKTVIYFLFDSDEIFRASSPALMFKTMRNARPLLENIVDENSLFFKIVTFLSKMDPSRQAAIVEATTVLCGKSTLKNYYFFNVIKILSLLPENEMSSSSFYVEKIVKRYDLNMMPYDEEILKKIGSVSEENRAKLIKITAAKINHNSDIRQILSNIDQVSEQMGWESTCSGFHEKFIREAIGLAQSARDHGNHPFGALLVHNGKVILKAENLVVTSKDFTAHAELTLVKEAKMKFPKEVLKKSILYTSTEPCAMCAGAIVWSGISHVVYGSPTEILAELAHGSFIVPSRFIFEKAKRKIICEGPCLEEEARQVHVGFWDNNTIFKKF